MTTTTMTDLRANLADLIGRAGFAHERVVIFRNGKEAAALVSIEDLKALERMEDEIDNAIADSRKDEPVRDWADVKRDLGL